MRYLVTGGVGFVGTNLIKKLLVEGHKVVSVDNYSTGLKENEQKDCEYFDIDICKVKDYPIDKPDVIFHLAALPRIQPSFDCPVNTFDANVKGTINVLEWARKKNCPVIYAGSSSNHGDKFSNPYTFSKWQGEELCRLYSKLYDLPTSICRFYNVYGPYELTEGDYCTLIGIFKNQYKNNQPLTITGNGEQRRDFTHVDDIVDGLVKCHTSMFISRHSTTHLINNFKEFEFGRGKNYSVNEIADAFGVYPRKYIDERPGEMRETLCTDTLANEFLDWKPEKDILDSIKGIV